MDPFIRSIFLMLASVPVIWAGVYVAVRTEDGKWLGAATTAGGAGMLLWGLWGVTHPFAK
jgi:hypothetical protein